MTKAAKYIRFKRYSSLLAIVVAGHLSACASIDKAGIEDGISKLGTSIKEGVGKVTSGRAGLAGGSNVADAAQIAAKYPVDQMPHTMMSKPVAEGRLSSGYGYRINPKGIRVPRRHKGIDYAAPRGTAIYAAESGVIDKLYVSKSYGNYIQIAHENNFYTAYAHMNAFADDLKVGSKVARGQIIGQVGSTGKSSGPHLHFELKYGGKFVDPLFKVAPAALAKTE